MSVPFLALSWSLGTILALQSPIQAQAADSQLPGRWSGFAQA
jgi:hypothetical protein